jgi:hypothetical protein
MRTNISLLTTSAHTAISQDIAEYQNAIIAHTGGDWSKHNQLCLYPSIFTEPITGHTLTGCSSLRLQLRGINPDGSGNGIFIIPAIMAEINIDLGSVPFIVQHPASQTAVVGTSIIFTSTVASAVAVTYQWQKNSVNISNATSSSYGIASVSISDQAIYQLIVTNKYGSTTSNNATLTVV